MTPEGEVKAEIVVGLKSRGIPYFMPVQQGFGKRGVDFYCTLPPSGRALLIEAKRAEGGKVSAIQKKILGENTAAGGLSIVARCWEDVREQLC